MNSEIVLPLLEFRPYQKKWWNAFFVDHYKNLVLISHRRSGKDLFCINLIAAAMTERVGTYLYLLPEQAHAKRVIWDGLTGAGKRFIDYFPRQLIKRINHSEMIIEYYNGSIFRLGGADLFNKHIGTNPILIVFGEYSLQREDAWNYLRPVLLENQGKVIFQFTPRSYNHAYNLYMMAQTQPDWFVSKLSINETTHIDGTPIVTKTQIDDEIKLGFDEALINQEYYCSFEGPNSGSYYGKLMTEAMECGHILDFEIKKEFPVNTAWDIGVNNSTTLWLWQEYGGMCHFIYAYDNTDEGVEHYYLKLIELSNKFQIKYGIHYAPHDIKVQEWGSGKTRIHQAYELGLYLKDVPKISVSDGMMRVRRILPKCVFHKTNCSKGIDALRSYKRKWNNELKCYDDYPVKDWSTDYADSFRYFSIVVNLPSMTESKSSAPNFYL